jgi:UDP-N-acetylglucosamine 4,6-dehydratase
VFENSSFLITGGTGSFGNTMLERLLKTKVSRIVCFSRDESKQYVMQQSIADSRVNFIIGDIRNFDSVKRAMDGIDYLFHAAALKHVPASESFPLEFTRTNILGSHNVMKAASESRVKKAIFLSTDKAVSPINAMGMTKALMEKIVRSAENTGATVSCVTRYGNVIGSRGSVIPQFISDMKAGNPIRVTNLSMTRFMMSLQESVDLVMHALSEGQSGDLFVQKSPATKVQNIIESLTSMLSIDSPKILEIGVRPGEKIHETLLSAEEMYFASENERFFKVASIIKSTDRTKNRKTQNDSEYTSKTTRQLDTNELTNLLEKIPEIAALL